MQHPVKSGSKQKYNISLVKSSKGQTETTRLTTVIYDASIYESLNPLLLFYLLFNLIFYLNFSFSP